MRQALGCVWPRMLWLADGLYDSIVDSDDAIRAARPHDAFETLMWTLRRRLDPNLSEPDWQVGGRSCPVGLTAPPDANSAAK